eukprot:950458_1
MISEMESFCYIRGQDLDILGAVLSSSLAEMNERLAYLSDRFQCISAATGLTKPDSIVTKFFLKEEICSELQVDAENKAKKLTEVKDIMANFEEKLGSAKGSFSESRWRDVEQIQETHRAVHAGMKASESRLEDLCTRLTALQESLFTLQNAVVDKTAGES